VSHDRDAVALSPIELQVNGRTVRTEARPGARLLDVLRAAGHTEVKEGCGEGECGACTVWLDGRAVCSCLVLAESAAGCAVTTVACRERPDFAALQAALVRETGTQCGFCTPGIVLAAAELIERQPDPDEAEIRAALSGNLCRCTGYTRIVSAVHNAAAARRRERAP